MKTNSLPKVLVALFATCLISYVFISCKDVETSPLQEQAKQQTKEITVENGRLKFIDTPHFKEVLEVLRQKKTVEELDVWEKKFDGFVSQRTIFNQITEKDVEKIAKSNSLSGYEDYATLIPDYDGESRRLVKQVDGDAFGTLFSKDAIVIIGNNAYKYTRDKLIKFQNYKKEDFERYKKGESLKNVLTSTISIEKLDSKLRTKEIPHAGHCTDYYQSNKRFAADYNIHKCGSGPQNNWACEGDDGFFRRFNVTAMHEKRFAGIWWYSEADVLKREGRINNIYNLDDGPHNNVSTLNFDLGFDERQYWTSIWVRVIGTNDGNIGDCTCSN